MEPGEGDASAEVSPEELERLRAERDELRHEVEELEDRPGKRRRTRRILAVVLVVLTVLSLAMAVPGTWVRRTVGDTDRYVGTVGPLASDPAVQEYLARTITDQVFVALGVQERLAQVLQERDPRLAFLAGPITTAVQDFVQEQVQKLVSSQAFATLWSETNRFAHAQIIAVLNGDTGSTVTIVQDKVVLNLLPIVTQALGQVSSVATDLIGRPVTLPPIDVEKVPAEAITAIEQATGVDLPDTFGQLVVLDGSELAAAQDAFSLANRLVIALVLLTLVCFVLALWISVRRRRTLIQIMTASALVLVIERRLAIAGGTTIVNRAKPENRSAVLAVVDALRSSLLAYTKWLLLIAVVVLVLAIVTAPYPWVVTLRGWVRDLVSAIGGAARGADRSAAVGWIAGHRDPLLVGTAFVAVVLLLWLDVGWLGFLVIALAAAALAFIVWRVAEGSAVVPPE